MSTTEVKSSKNDNYATFGKQTNGNTGQTNGTMERSSSMDSIQSTSLVAVPEGALESNGASHLPKTRYFQYFWFQKSSQKIGLELNYKN